MARMLLERRYWERVEERRARLGIGAITAWRAAEPPEFIDYWPAVPGTYPEKVLFAELVSRRVNFYYATYFGDIPFTSDVHERYRPDFLLPDYNVIIEITGAYWHTRPGMFEHDALKHALFTAAGYKVYFLIDREIVADVSSLIDREVPELLNPSIRGTNAIVADQPVDPTAPLRARLQQWPKISPVRFRRTAKGIASSWKGKTFVVQPQPPIGPLYSHKLASTGKLDEWEQYGLEWKGWITDLEAFFKSPEAQARYAELYTYFEKWRDWWYRFRNA